MLPLALLARYSGLSRQLNRFGDRAEMASASRAAGLALAQHPVDAPHVALPIAQHRDVMREATPALSRALYRDNRQRTICLRKERCLASSSRFQPHRAVLTP